jgi:chemotaxis protein methyltransferase CheR
MTMAAARAERSPMPDRVFARYQAYIHEVAGIWLNPSKKSLVIGRLVKRLRALELTSYDEYLERVQEGRDPDELSRMLDCITTNETRFFREPQHFTLLEHRLLPMLRAQADAGERTRQVAVWSAGCSSGEEPYSLAMLFDHVLPASQGWNVRIHATDLSTRVLERARAGVYSQQRAHDIPHHLLRKYMLRGTRTQAGNIKVGPELRARVHFARLNLNEPAYPVPGPFDFVFCRNVLIYFNAESKARIVDQLLRHLSPTGHLFLGHAESLMQTQHRLTTLIPTVYTRPAPHALPRRRTGS